MNKHDLLDFCQSGIYEIVCRSTNCSYIGESSNIMYRLGRHFHDLDTKIHENPELQKDWLLYGRQNFCFYIIDSGPQWRKKVDRSKREKEIVLKSQYPCYNVPSSVSANLRKDCTINGILYSSGAEAARKLGISSSTSYRALKKSNNKEVKTFLRTKTISINGIQYSSLTKVMSKLGVSKSTMFRRLNSSKYPTWQYSEKTRSNDYPERE